MKSYFLVLLFAFLADISTPGALGAKRVTKLHSYESVIEFDLSIRKLEDAENPSCAQSSAFKLGDVTWKIQACRNSDYDVDYSEDSPDHKKYVHMSLVSVWDGNSAAWSCEASATFKLLAINGEQPIVRKFHDYNFNKDEPVRTIEDFVNKEDLFANHIKLILSMMTMQLLK